MEFAMHRIEIDDEVYAALAQRARGFEVPNDVLRREYGLDGTPSGGRSELLHPSTFVAGRLLPLIEMGLVKPGDELVHHQPRKGRTFSASVDEAGWIVTDLGRYKEPSPALRDLVGSQIDGWFRWTHVSSGQTLKQLKVQMLKRAVPGPK